MRPELFRLDTIQWGEVGFPAYFLLLVAGFLFATGIGAMWARRIGKDPDVVVDLGLACILAGVIGGRLLHVIADGYFWDYVHLCTDPMLVDWRIEQAQCGTDRFPGVWDELKGVCHPKNRDCFAWAKFWAGGLAYYGGFFGASAAAWWLLKRDRFPFWKAADMAGFAIPLGLGFGRMGCLLAGCCFGLRTDGPFGLAFPPGSPASEAQWKLQELAAARMPSHPVHPTQIYESAVSFAIAAVCLLWVHGRKRYDGQVFVAFLALYAIGRFVLEFLRADDRGGLLGLSTSQLIGVVLVGVALLIHRQRAAKAAKAVPAAV
ncbi:prolipoprotein diacylglyceryl transferase [Chondromyces apiculatus]|uniref:Phosphatidylglycerol--prolipoprotein diacylglyceryl transferase n=1 Tax=Chondromyces apiculatus DSM 436 TaxID=1192034 RepID=A0A017TFA7_9BACT|nr:prolipoprotein diacylglyceryl transferase [Chondromyces apiculatus]EYF07973.1 Prolipoprotein diacylglyceryl transferase [Chondromyces apiculatus DSM 436]